MSERMQREPTHPGSRSWLEPWMLTSLQDLQRAIGEVIGIVRSQHEGTSRRLDEIRAEMAGMAGRFDRLEAEMRAGRPHRGAPAWTWERILALPWRHILTIAALAVLGLMGHVSPAEIKRHLLGG